MLYTFVQTSHIKLAITFKVYICYRSRFVLNLYFCFNSKISFQNLDHSQIYHLKDIVMLTWCQTPASNSGHSVICGVPVRYHTVCHSDCDIYDLPLVFNFIYYYWLMSYFQSRKRLYNYIQHHTQHHTSHQSVVSQSLVSHWSVSQSFISQSVISQSTTICIFSLSDF